MSATISAVNPRAPRAWGAPLRRRPAARSLAPRPRSPLLRVVPRAGFFGDLYADDGDHAARDPPDPTTARALEDARRDVEASRARVRDAEAAAALWESRARAVRADLESARGTDAAVVAAAERRAEELARVLDGTNLELRRVRETFRRERDAVTRDLERARAAAADRDSKVMDAVRQRDDARRVADERVASLERAREDLRRANATADATRRERDEARARARANANASRTNANAR